MLTPPFENMNGNIPDLRTERESQKKPLDSAAFGLVALSIALVCAGLFIRSEANQQALTQTIQAMIHVGDQLWVALPDELVQIDLKESNKLSRIPYTQMQLPSPITYAIKTRNNYWVQLYSGQVWTCDLANLPCHQVMALPNGEEHYYSIALLPKPNQIIAVNNFTSQMTTLDADNIQALDTNIAYSLPPMDQKALQRQILNTVGSMDGWHEGKLYRPNRLHVINNMLVQTDTGNQRIIAWPLDADGMPEWQTPKSILAHTTNQAYDVTYIAHTDPLNDRWLVLESDAVLDQGRLMSYSANSEISTGVDIDLNTPDPTLLTNYDDHSVLIADHSMSKIVQVNFSPYANAPPGVLDYNVTGLDDRLTQLKHKSHLYKLLADCSLALCLAPFLALLILFRRGYDLNQKIGRS